MTLNRHKEPRLACYLWRIALGLAGIADGLVCLLSVGHVNLGAQLAAARRLARSRL